jgi:transcriptional regulator with PAS, ATPase and Fis domain
VEGQTVPALEDLAALVRVQELLDAEVERKAVAALSEGEARTEVERKAVAALSEGEARTEVARALGVSRSSLYRRFEAVDHA